MKFLGLDFSTQSVKGMLIDLKSGTVENLPAVNFGKDLPHYGAPYGFVTLEGEPLSRHSDPMMWVEALDLLLERSEADFSQVVAISGSGQQHGSVYLNGRFDSVLASLKAELPLKKQLETTLARKTAPIWMDRATSEECRELDDRFGSELQTITGSPAIERFTGPQIRHFWKKSPEAYAETRRIHLVSSFICSVLAGKSAPIDFGDGAGMNLLDLRSLVWNPELAEYTAPSLMEKLPPAVSGGTVVGPISKYFVEKYGFNPECRIVVWSGDNPCSLVGLGVADPGSVGISLGTSDTLFAGMKNFTTDPEGCGHVFGNPAGGFMSLICFTNGSLARERVKDECGATWNFFDNDACQRTMPGNDGKYMLPYYESENTPKRLIPGVKYNFEPEQETAEVRIRSLLESQALSLKLHSLWMKEDIKRLIVTGGAANCAGLQQILADVFQAPVDVLDTKAAAPLGAAFMAAVGAGEASFGDLWKIFTVPSKRILPVAANAGIYARALEEYKKLESQN